MYPMGRYCFLRPGFTRKITRSNAMSNETKDLTTEEINPLTLIDKAVQSNLPVETIERLMDLQDRWDAKKAKTAFNDALARFQANQPVIYKSKKGHNYDYAPLPDIQIAIGDLLKKVGLTYRFEQEHSDNLIAVTCVVTHIDGHSERNRMVAMPDDSGSKNAVQAIGSTVSYLMRYTLIGALGLLTADKDMDGRVDTASGYINEDQVTEINDLIKETKSNEAKLLEMFRAKSVDTILESQYSRVTRLLRSKAK